MFDRIFDFEKYVSELLKAVSNKCNYVEKNHIFFTYHTTSDKSFLVSPYSTVSTVVLSLYSPRYKKVHKFCNLCCTEHDKNELAKETVQILLHSKSFKEYIFKEFT